MAEKDDQTGLAPAHEPFGQDLRREREMREISIREIAESTKISTRFLEAIEHGDLSSLPAPVFTRGFIREYASYLGLDPEELVDRYMGMIAREEKQRQNEEAEMRERISGTFPVLPGRGALKWIAIAVIAILILAIGVYLLSKDGDSDGESATRPETIEQPISQPPAADPAADPGRAETIEMTLRATSDSWINLQVDGQEPIDFTLTAGQSRNFEGRERIVLRTVGNAGGVDVTLNGVQIEPIGRVNQVVRDVEFDLSTVNAILERQRSAPESRSE